MKLSLAIFLLSSTAAANGEATYEPGNFSGENTLEVEGGDGILHLSKGLMGAAIAHSGKPVTLADGTTVLDADGNEVLYHEKCDGGAAIPKSDNNGSSSGYYYVSNSEIGDHPETLTGGTYSLEFNDEHELLGYTKILGETAKNCHGGETPWGTFVSCEENRAHGRCWQVDPTGEKEAVQTMVTGQTENTPLFGNWEAFAWDPVKNMGYVTNDDYPKNPGFKDEQGNPTGASYSGAIVRFEPDDAARACLEADTDEGKWCALDSGTVRYLKLTPKEDPDGSGGSEGTFEWAENKEDANPELYAGSEGAHVEDGVFTFSTIVDRYLFRLDLNLGTYVRSAVPFPFEPDNLRVLKGDGTETVYLCTDGDDQPGDAVWGWDNKGAFRMFYEENHSYPAGVDFSTDKKDMYVSLYGHTTYRFWRTDGMAFDEPAKEVTYEVMGGIDEGKTHAEIFQKYNEVYEYENPTVMPEVTSDAVAIDGEVAATNGEGTATNDEDTATNGKHEEDHAVATNGDHADDNADDHGADEDAEGAADESAAAEVAAEEAGGGKASTVSVTAVVGAIAGALIL